LIKWEDSYDAPYEIQLSDKNNILDTDGFWSNKKDALKEYNYYKKQLIKKKGKIDTLG
jgi:hypothetical protein